MLINIHFQLQDKVVLFFLVSAIPNITNNYRLLAVFGKKIAADFAWTEG